MDLLQLVQFVEGEIELFELFVIAVEERIVHELRKLKERIFIYLEFIDLILTMNSVYLIKIKPYSSTKFMRLKNIQKKSNKNKASKSNKNETNKNTMKKLNIKLFPFCAHLRF